MRREVFGDFHFAAFFHDGDAFHPDGGVVFAVPSAEEFAAAGADDDGAGDFAFADGDDGGGAGAGSAGFGFADAALVDAQADGVVAVGMVEADIDSGGERFPLGVEGASDVSEFCAVVFFHAEDGVGVSEGEGGEDEASADFFAGGGGVMEGVGRRVGDAEVGGDFGEGGGSDDDVVKRHAGGAAQGDVFGLKLRGFKDGAEGVGLVAGADGDFFGFAGAGGEEDDFVVVGDAGVAEEEVGAAGAVSALSDFAAVGVEDAVGEVGVGVRGGGLEEEDLVAAGPAALVVGEEPGEGGGDGEVLADAVQDDEAVFGAVHFGVREEHSAIVALGEGFLEILISPGPGRQNSSRPLPVIFWRGCGRRGIGASARFGSKPRGSSFRNS